VNLLQHRHQPLLVDLAVLGRQLLAGAELLQHVVHVGDRQPRVRRLLPLAVGVERPAEFADALLLHVAAVGKRKRIGTAASYSAVDPLSLFRLFDSHVVAPDGTAEQVAWSFSILPISSKNPVGFPVVRKSGRGQTIPCPNS
jgi:hypothetical protein